MDADVQRLGDPVAWNAARVGLNAIDVPRRGASHVVNVAGQPRLVLWVTDEENALDGGESRTSQLWHGVDSRGGTLRVSLKDEAHVWVVGESLLDVVDDVGCSGAGVLVLACWVDGVVLRAARDLAHDVGVHGAETCRWSLGLAGATSVDES